MNEGDQGRTEHEVEIDRLRAELVLLKSEVEILRHHLWLRHDPMHYSILYGDDGEMQCAACLLDFKRMSAVEIVARWEQMKLTELAGLQKIVEGVTKKAITEGQIDPRKWQSWP